MAKRSQGRESKGLNSTICFIIDRCVTLKILPVCSGLQISLGNSALLFHSWYESQMKCFGKWKVFWYHNYLFVIQNFIISKQSTPSLLHTQSQTTYLMHTSQQRHPFPSLDVLSSSYLGTPISSMFKAKINWEGATLAPTGKPLSSDCQRKRWPYCSLEEGEEAEMSPGL